MRLHRQNPDRSYCHIGRSCSQAFRGHFLDGNRLNGSEDYFVRVVYVSHEQCMNILSLYKFNKKDIDTIKSEPSLFAHKR